MKTGFFVLARSISIEMQFPRTTIYRTSDIYGHVELFDALPYVFHKIFVKISQIFFSDFFKTPKKKISTNFLTGRFREILSSTFFA